MPVEPIHDEYVPSRDLHKLGCRDVNPGSAGQPQLYFLPSLYVPFVAARARELGNGQPPGHVDDCGLGACTAQ